MASGRTPKPDRAQLARSSFGKDKFNEWIDVVHALHSTNLKREIKISFGYGVILLSLALSEAVLAPTHSLMPTTRGILSGPQIF